MAEKTRTKKFSIIKILNRFNQVILDCFAELYLVFILLLSLFYVGLILIYFYFENKFKPLILLNESVVEEQESEIVDYEKTKYDPYVYSPDSQTNTNATTNLDITNWKTFTNSSYYFTLRYPNDWPEPKIVQSVDSSDVFNIKYVFEKPNNNQNSPLGFEVMVFSANYLSLEETNPLKFKNFTTIDGLNCDQFSKTKIGQNKAYEASIVSVRKDNKCFNETYFFSVTKNGYIYNFVPVPLGSYHHIGYEGERNTLNDLPEFQQILDTITFQTPPPPKPKAPKPFSASSVGDKLVCRGDDPTRWSLTNKPGHLDMECCLDPDETPNPWCSYSPENVAKVNAMKAEGPPKDWRKKWDRD